MAGHDSVPRVLLLLAQVPTAERRARWWLTAREGFAKTEFDAAYAEMQLTFDRMEEALTEIGGPWLLGEMYTLADIAIVPFVERIDDLRPDLLKTGRWPEVVAWFARCQERPAYGATFVFEGKDSKIGAVRQALGIN